MRIRFLTYSFIFPLLLLAPGLGIGVRTFYPFEFLPFVIIFLISRQTKLLSKRKVKIIMAYFVSVLFLILGQLLLGSSISGYYLIRIGILFTLPLLVGSLFSSADQLKKSLVIIFGIILVIGYIQLIDVFLLSNKLKFNNLVAFLYPYRGELSETGLMRSNNLQLKSYALFTPTSVADGQQILAGNLFAIISLVLLYWNKRWLFILGSILTVLSMSRGSWAMLLVGLLIYMYDFASKMNFLSVFKILLFTSVISFIARFSPFWDYLNFRVLNTLFVFGLSDIEVGSTVDPRTTSIWPEFISKMNEGGWLIWFFGGLENVYADSGYFGIIRDSGLFSLVFIFWFFYKQYSETNKSKLIRAIFIAIIIGSVVNPVYQGYRLLFTITLILSACSINEKEDYA